MKKIKLLGLLLIANCCWSVSAQNNAKTQIESVFNTLVSGYSGSKIAPKLQVIDEKTLCKTPANFEFDTKTIKVDAHFYALCRTFGKDSVNALSIVISHELTHYYKGHDFCSDFAFAIRKEKPQLAKRIKDAKNLIGYETEADSEGLFYAAIAGFQPFEIEAKLLDAIYSKYKLSDVNPGYPSKQERKAIGAKAQQKAADLYLIFEKGTTALKSKNYDLAISSFEDLNRIFPSRENYNNCGVAKVLKALPFKTLGKAENDYPERFVYPIEYDTVSRLKTNGTRSVSDENKAAYTNLLKSAKLDFETAITKDPSYYKSYVNLACSLELMGFYNSAIGKIEELPQAEQVKPEAQRILAIAFYNADKEEEAEEIWEKLKM